LPGENNAVQLNVGSSYNPIVRHSDNQTVFLVARAFRLLTAFSSLALIASSSLIRRNATRRISEVVTFAVRFACCVAITASLIF